MDTAPWATSDFEVKMEKKLTRKQFLEERAALLTVVLDIFEDVHDELEKIRTLDEAYGGSEGFGIGAISELVSDAQDAAEALREDVDRAASRV